ncbi:DHA2 family multidrug resistance protein-like MFS transporter [Tamaricihabitans halophyticus]|uniref:DHA2 family multidrug resistance protein-like MFS transporter n=2 Tax=Tamaricihabitans halophyticus TaxID=1262583 RepID=A0A4V2SSY5_9PSEU|nr:DHA2 family multidrug resistance protein-like MFS transporter [Tamaricihabitans halophyticus]
MVTAMTNRPPVQPQSAGPRPTAGVRQWIGLAVLVLPALLVSMDMSVLLFAMPFVSADLRPTGTEMLWILDIYGFLLAGLLITMGSLGDRVGRRKLLIFGAIVFGGASVLAAYSPSPELLIAARALLGIGGATLAPSTLALIRAMFTDAGQRRTAVGIWTAGFAGGGALGPIIGGVLLEQFWWGSVFLLNVPVMVLLVVLAPMLLPEYRDPNATGFDLISAVLSLAAILPAIYGIKEIAEYGLSWAAVAALALGVVVGAFFLRRQRRGRAPLIDLDLFRARPFSAALLANTLTMFAMFGVMLYSAQFVQLVLGFRPLTAALASLPGFLAMPIGITAAMLIVRRVRPGFVVAGGLATAAVGMALLTTVTADTGLVQLIGLSAVMVGGIGAVTALANDMIIGTAPPERAGSASALSETGAEFGGALGMAVLGSVGTAVYRTQVLDDAPGAVPDAAVQAAGDTRGAAQEVAGTLPGELAGPLLDVADQAFAAGLRMTVLTGAVIMTIAAVLAAVMLRRVRQADLAAAAADRDGSDQPQPA